SGPLPGELLPVDAAAVDVVDRIDDFSGHPEVRNRAAAAFEGAVVVDDDETTHRDLVIQRREGFHRRLIHIAIEAKNGERLDGCAGKRIPEPTDKKLDLIIE